MKTITSSLLIAITLVSTIIFGQTALKQLSADESFQTASLLAHGGGNYKTVKRHKVYLAINNNNTHSNSI